MIDITQRLRRPGPLANGDGTYAPGAGHADPLLAEAADEIERLRQEVAEQARANGMGSEREAKLMAERAELQRELEPLRQAKAGGTPMPLLALLADIRAAAGDPRGKLMQSELLLAIQAQHADAERYRRLRDDTKEDQ